MWKDDAYNKSDSPQGNVAVSKIARFGVFNTFNLPGAGLLAGGLLEHRVQSIIPSSNDLRRLSVVTSSLQLRQDCRSIFLKCSSEHLCLRQDGSRIVHT